VPVTRETKIPLESYIPKERTPTASACRFSTVNEELPIDVENNSPRIGSSQSISPSTVLPIRISSSLWSREYISKLTISEPFMGTDLENISFGLLVRPIDVAGVLFSKIASSLWSCKDDS
jgi:hypothetical protein